MNCCSVNIKSRDRIFGSGSISLSMDHVPLNQSKQKKFAKPILNRNTPKAVSLEWVQKRAIHCHCILIPNIHGWANAVQHHNTSCLWWSDYVCPKLLQNTSINLRRGSITLAIFKHNKTKQSKIKKWIIWNEKKKNERQKHNMLAFT